MIRGEKFRMMVRTDAPVASPTDRRVRRLSRDLFVASGGPIEISSIQDRIIRRKSRSGSIFRVSFRDWGRETGTRRASTAGEDCLVCDHGSIFRPLSPAPGHPLPRPPASEEISLDAEASEA